MMDVYNSRARLVVFAVLALGMGGSSAMAAWFEDFETGYVDGAQLQTNAAWDGGGLGLLSTTGVPNYSGTMSALRFNQDFWNAHAYRSTFGGAATGTTLFARLNASRAGGASLPMVKIGLGDGNETAGHGSFNFTDLMWADHVWIGLEHFTETDENGTTESVVLTAQGTDYTTFGQLGHVANGSSVVLRQHECCRASWWYDVRLTQTGALTFLPEYRLSAPGDVGAWTALNIVTAGADFVPTYVGVRSHNRGTIDDIGWTPVSDLGDMNNDGNITTADVPLFIEALVDRAAYDARGLGLNASLIGDVNMDGVFDLGDSSAFSALLGGPASASAVPEPSSIMLLAIALGAVVLRRRWLFW